MAPGMNPDRKGYFGPDWSQAERSPVGGATAGSNGFNFDTKGLDDLKTKLAGIISQFDVLDKKIGGVSGKLGGLTGGGTSSGGSITAASFASSPAAAQINKNLSQFPGGPTSAWPGSGKPNPNTPGPGGSGNTSAGFGGVGTTLAAVAGASMIAGGVSSLAGKVSGLQAGGVPVQLAAAQQATITGGATYNNVNAWNGVMNTGQGDQAQAMNMAMQNPYLASINPQSKNFNNMRGLLNTTQKLGGVSASSAMGFLNDLTSNKATNFFAQLSGGQGGALDPRTGKLRNPQQALLSTLQTATGTRGLSGNKLSGALKSISNRPGQWAAATQNFEQAGLSSSDVVLMRELAAQGGNLTKAQGGQVSKTVAEQLLSQTTQKTSLNNQLMQETSGLQVAFSKLQTTVSHLEQTLAGWTLGRGGHAIGGLLSKIPGVGGVLGGAMSLAGKIPGISSIPGIGSILGDPDTTSGMQPNLAHGITAMKRANPSLQINSGHRSSAQQSALYALKGGKGVARPGHSPHQLGKAADIGPPSQFGWLAANAQKFGLATDRNEPWHVQAMGDPVSGANVTGAQVVSKASSQLGVDYVWGGETAGKAFDCSGLVQWVFAQVGVNLPRTSQGQASAGTAVKGLNNAQAGDLILYNEPGEGPNSHVAIYIGGGKQIEAPHTGAKVQVSAVDTSHISTIRRVIGGGAGGKVVAAAQGAVGQSSNDSSNHSGAGASVSAGAPGGLSNSFISGLSGSWLGGGGSAGGGGGGGSGPAAGGSSGTSGSTTTASTGSTTLVGGAGGPISSPTGFSKAVLSNLGLPATSADVTSLNAWQQMEGQWTASGIYNAMQMHDPLNTNLPEKGGHSLGGTWFYPDWATGVSATVSTIKQGNMAAIYNALKSNDNLASFGSAAESTPWAASAYGGKSWPAPSGSYAVGDPTGGFQPNVAAPSMGGPGPVTALHSGGGGRGVSVSIGPVYVQGSQADANNLANMVASAIKGHREIQAVAKT